MKGWVKPPKMRCTECNNRATQVVEGVRVCNNPKCEAKAKEGK
jgi:hypothetical protein